MSDVFHMIAGADLIKEKYFQKQVHFCTVCNGKSGRCTEFCRFCIQSSFFDSGIDTFPILETKYSAKELKNWRMSRSTGIQ